MKRKFTFIFIAFILAVLLGKCTSDNSKPELNEIITDIDGNTYHTIKISKQIWMDENLKVTKYRNGDPIYNVISKAQWSSLVDGAYCNYNNDTNNTAVYGRLYNWYAIADNRNIAPEGWHVATEKDFENLTKELRGILVAGGKLKETGTLHWKQHNMNATNESNFSALPCGYRNSDYGTFHLQNANCFFWTASNNKDSAAWIRMLSSNHEEIFRSAAFKTSGFSVRCVKN